MHSGPFTHPCTLMNGAMESLHQIQKPQVSGVELDISDSQPSVVRWTNPPSNTYKANWDIALDSNRKRMGIGVVIRDEQGYVTTTLCRPVENSFDPTIGEAMGALVAVEFCRDLGLRDIVLEGDSKLVINAILVKAPSRSTYGHIVGDTLEVLKVSRS
jgi:hypothetical protein